MMLVQFVSSYRKMVSHILHARKLVLFFSVCRAAQVDLSLLITSWVSDALTNPYDHDFVSDDCNLASHFPINTSNDICITPFDLYDLTS